MERNLFLDYREFFLENLTNQDKYRIAVECQCSVSTINNYIKFKAANIHLAKAIIESGVNILLERGIDKELQNLLKR